MPTNPRLGPRERHCLTQGLGATERRGNVFVHYDPAFSALLQYHGPARIEVRAGAFFADEIDSQGEGCPSEGSAAVHSEIIVELGTDAAVELKRIFFSAVAAFLPVAVLH